MLHFLTNQSNGSNMYKWFDLLLKNVITLFFIKPNEHFKEKNKTIEFEYEK
jgi:hypothetical protein